MSSATQRFLHSNFADIITYQALKKEMELAAKAVSVSQDQ